MEPITMGLLLGAGMGALKGASDEDKAKRQRAMESQIARFSPWSGMAAQRVQEADPMGSVMQGGLAGAMMGNQFGKGAGAAADTSAAAPAGTAAYTPGMGMAPMATSAQGYGQAYAPWNYMGR